MKKKKLLFLSGSIFSLAISLFTLNAIKNVDVSYAQLSDLPTNDFKTNVTVDTQKINLVGDALGNSALAGQFVVEKDIKVGNVPLYKLTKNKVTPGATETFELNNEINPMTINDDALERILQVGYSNISHARTVFEANSHGNGTLTNSEKEYITQIAIWMHIYKNYSHYSDYCANNGCTFYTGDDPSVGVPYSEVNAALTTAINSNAKLAYIRDILEEADNADIVQTQGQLFNVSKDGLNDYTFNDNYILTGEFKINAGFANNFVSYSVSVNDPNHYGIYLTDSRGNKLGNGTNVTNLASGTVVRLHIPISGNLEDMNLKTSGINYTVYTLYSNNLTALAYKVTDTTNTEVPLIAVGAHKKESFSDVLLGSSEIYPTSGSTTIHNFTVISKVDAVSRNEIADAHLEIYNSSDMNDDGKSPKENTTSVEAWVSEANKSHKVYLPDGSYGLCETIYPDGYGYNEAGDHDVTTCVPFVVNNGNGVTVKVMENFPIPNTGLFSSKITYTVGGVLIVIGVLGMAVVLGKDKKKQQIQSEQEQQSI